MLDVETKRRIDTARDILVGKVPDPKSQVEQITIALIYKFMDDMDNESIQLGGKKRFFTDEYEKYAWNKLLDPRMGGYEVLNLYAEAITKLNQNPNLPQLFREIFKNAYLPYRDPETLKMFLKTINEFSYEHSERLGDAFEYLLSVLSSQGDAGQFRTPRHIIDFMVEIVAPQKNEIILDPACGTAGFLISAYKYILRENTSEKYKNQNGNNGNYRADLLSVDDRKKLLDNFKGYDISPDMVRLSLVNMYLHGFVQPKIQEYDTLTSEDKWDERADVILANPPFMSPKGGIRPHKRFSVQSNRSEVLFVDYIAEHLTSNGRAAVIVPEGIVFRGDNAYKKLRKILVENYLYVVLSLPKGVFNPYADVKTSILLMDKQMVKKTDSILFVKIENDGFDLGDQRKPIDKNDLPDALKVIKEYVASVKSGKLKSFIAEKKPCSALLVQKEKIAENGEYNLTADRYRINEKIKHQKWEMVRLGEVCEFISGYAFKSENFLTKPSDNSYLPVIKIGNLNNKGKLSSNFEYYKYNNYLEKYLVKKGDILIAMTGATVGKTAVSQFDNCLLNQRVGLVRSTKKILQEYLRSILFSDLFYNYCQRIAGGGAQGNLSPNEIQNFPIPLPPIEIQKKIVAEIENYQKIIDGCKQIIDSWKPNIERYLRKELKNYLANHPELKNELQDGWNMVKLGEVCEVNPKKSELKGKNFEISFVPMADVNEQNYYFEPKQTKKLIEVYNGYNYFAENDVIIAKITPCFENGKSAIVKNLKNGIGFGSTEFIVLRARSVTIPEWIYWFVSDSKFINEGKNHMSGSAGQKRLSIDFVREYKIPLPPIEVQQKIVEEINKEEEALEKIKLLKANAEKRIEEVIDEVWGEKNE